MGCFVLTVVVGREEVGRDPIVRDERLNNSTANGAENGILFPCADSDGDYLRHLLQRFDRHTEGVLNVFRFDQLTVQIEKVIADVARWSKIRSKITESLIIIAQIIRPDSNQSDVHLFQ